MISTLRESGHPCDDSIIYRHTRGGGRKHGKIHSARRALWRQFRVFGVDWELMDYKDKIADIKHARRTTSKLKCKINDAQERVSNNFKLKSSKIDKQPRLSVKPRLCTYNIEAKMLKKKRTGSYQMKRKASSESKASSVSQNDILRTSPDDVTHFFFHIVVLERCHLERSWLERNRVYQRKIFSVGRSEISCTTGGIPESARRR